MKHRLPFLLGVVALFAVAAVAQNSNSAPPAGQNSGQGQGGGYGRRGGGGGGIGMMGRGTIGTVTEAAADHYSIKTETGDVYTVHFDSNTRIVKQPTGGGMRGQGGGGGQAGRGRGGGSGEGMGGGMGRGNPPEEIKSTDIKVGDMIRAMGDVDATAKTVTARAVMQLDPTTVAQMREMEANFGKTWVAGKVTTIDGAKITLTGAMDNAPHTVIADENTTFRKRRDPVTLADIQVGDTVRVEGALKDGAFAATTVSVGGMTGIGEGQGGERNPPQHQ
jgi:uncharacterized protein DUF5666